VRAAPLRNDRLEEPDWLSSGEGMTSISFGGFIAFASPVSIPGESSIDDVCVRRGRGTLLVGLITAQQLRWIFTGGDYFQSEDL
jgi:hypothetical protein